MLAAVHQLLSTKESRLSSQLQSYMRSNPGAHTFYWCAEDINGFDMHEPPNTLERAQRLLCLLKLVTHSKKYQPKMIVDWDGTALN